MKIKRVLPFIIAFLLLFIIAYIVGIGNIINAFKGANWWFLPFVVLLEIFEYFLQVFRAKLLFDNSNHEQKFLDFAKDYSIGHASAFVIPSRALGEVVRFFSLSKLLKIKLSKISGILSIERISDIFALLLFTFISLLFIKETYVYYVSFIFLAILICFLLFILSRRVQFFFLSFVKKIFKKSSLVSFFEDYVSIGYKLMSRKKLSFLVFFIALVLWFINFFRFYVILGMFGFSLNIFLIGGIISVSYLVSIVFFLPGGIGVFEGGAVSALSYFGVEFASAFSAMFIERLFSFWIWIVIGLFFFNKKLFDKLGVVKNENNSL